MIPARAAALALVLAAPAAAPAQQTQTLHVATTPIDLGAEVLYAKDRGFFAKAGLDVQVELMSSGAAIAAGVASGSLDVAQANIVSLASAHERGLPFVIVAPAGLYVSDEPTTSLVVAKTSAVRSARDLENKTIAINGLRNITQIGADAWIAAHGGDTAKVRYVELPFPQMAAALATGRVDAAMIAEPELSDALAGGARELAQPYTAIADRFLIGGWFVTRPWASAHPEQLRRFAAAIVEAGRWANGHRSESAQILEKYTKVRVSSRMRRAVYADRLDAAQIQPLVDAAAKYGSLRAAFPAAELLGPA